MENKLLFIGVPSILIALAYLSFSWIVYRDSELLSSKVKLIFSLLSPACFVLLFVGSFKFFSAMNLLDDVYSSVNDTLDADDKGTVFVSGIYILFTVGVIPLVGMFLLKRLFTTIDLKIIEKENHIKP